MKIAIPASKSELRHRPRCRIADFTQLQCISLTVPSNSSGFCLGYYQGYEHNMYTRFFLLLSSHSACSFSSWFHLADHI